MGLGLGVAMDRRLGACRHRRGDRAAALFLERAKDGASRSTGCRGE